MIDLERLLELLDEAKYAIRCGCGVTTRAYLQLSRIELLQRLDDPSSPKERDRVLAAYFYFDHLAQAKSVRAAVQLAIEFWTGYDDGQNERTLPQRGRAIYQRGYRFGRDGS